MTTTRPEAPLRPGDPVLVRFGPTRGTERNGRGPAPVVPEAEMHVATRRAIVCPITGHVTPWTTKVMRPAGLAVSGAVPTDQGRSIDRNARLLRRPGSAPDRALAEVRCEFARRTGFPASPAEGSEESP